MNKAKASWQEADLVGQCQHHTPSQGDILSITQRCTPEPTVYLKTEAITSFISSFPTDTPSAMPSCVACTKNASWDEIVCDSTHHRRQTRTPFENVDPSRPSGDRADGHVLS